MRKAGYRVLLLLLLPLLLLSFTGHDAAAAASSKGKIIMDNKELALPKGIALENVNGSVMIPIRVVVENLGFQVSWDQKNRKVNVQQDGKSIELTVGQKKAAADGVILDLNAAPKQSGGTVLVPIRFVSEQFGLKVGWDNSDKIVYLSGGVATVANNGINVPTPTPVPAKGTAEPSASPVVPPTPSATPLTAGGISTGTPASTPQPSSTPGNNGSGLSSPVVKGAAFSSNQLMIAVSGNVKPNVSKLNGPDRIIVDFPGAVFASDFTGGNSGVDAKGSPQGKLDVAGYPMVTEVRYAMFSYTPSTVRFVIQTPANQPYQLITEDSNGLVIIDLNVLADPGSTNGGTGSGTRPVVVLDAGHGGKQSGAVSLTGKLEKNFNLAVINKAGNLLMQEDIVDVVFTRTSDITLGLQDRVDIAEAANATLFVSVHANSLTADANNNYRKVNGSETYYTRSSSLPLAKIMHKHLVAGTGFKDNGVRTKSLHVTRETSMPAVLLEAGYLTNSSNEGAMYTELLQDNLAREIVAGIKEYLGL